MAAFFGPKKRILIMGNHGVLVSGVDVATAFYDMYFLERSSQFQVGKCCIIKCTFKFLLRCFTS